MSFVIRRCTAKLPTPSYQMSNLQLICERFGARSQTSNERHSMMVSAFKRIQDVPFPTWTRKILYRWLMGAEVCARVTSRVQSSPVQSSPVQSSPVQSSRRLQIRLDLCSTRGQQESDRIRSPLTTDHVRLPDTWGHYRTGNFSSGRLGILHLVVVHDDNNSVDSPVYRLHLH